MTHFADAERERTVHGFGASPLSSELMVTPPDGHAPAGNGTAVYGGDLNSKNSTSKAVRQIVK